MARQNQHRREVALLSEAKERERRLIECRKTAEERKNYFESMERHMFATRSSVKVSKLETKSNLGSKSHKIQFGYKIQSLNPTRNVTYQFGFVCMKRAFEPLQG